METIECGNCGIVFGVPHQWLKDKRDSGGGFHCPNGHPRIFGEGRADKYRREAERLRQRMAEKDDEIASEQKRAAAYKGQVTRLKKRSAAGLCPCCNRHFTNLERHMATKHKDMDPAEPLRVVEGGKP